MEPLAYPGRNPPLPTTAERANPFIAFLKLTRALFEGDRRLEALAVAELAERGFDVRVHRSLRKGSQPAPPKLFRQTDLSQRRAAREDTTQRKKAAAERQFGNGQNGAAGGVTSSPTAERPSVARSAHREQS